MGDTSDLKERVYACIAAQEEGVYAKIIAAVTRINYNTVKGIVRILARDGIVKHKNGIRGLYVSDEKYAHGGIFDYNFHNLILTCPIPPFDKEFKPITNSLMNMVKTRLIIGKYTQMATLHVSTDYPINVSAILFVANHFINELKTQMGCEVALDSITISSIEFNKDYINLKLEGANCLTLSSMIAQYKLYQKKRGAREEFKMKVPIGMPEIWQLLKRGQFQAENRVEIEQLNKRIIKIDKQLSYIIKEIIMGGLPKIDKNSW